MATKPDSITELEFYGFEDVMRICGVRRSRAFQIIKKVNDLQEKKGKLVIRGKVNAAAFNSSF